MINNQLYTYLKQKRKEGFIFHNHIKILSLFSRSEISELNKREIIKIREGLNNYVIQYKESLD